MKQRHRASTTLAVDGLHGYAWQGNPCRVNIGMSVRQLYLQDEGGASASEPEDPVARGYARAAAELKEKLEEKNLVVEDKILK